MPQLVQGGRNSTGAALVGTQFLLQGQATITEANLVPLQRISILNDRRFGSVLALKEAPGRRLQQGVFALRTQTAGKQIGKSPRFVADALESASTCLKCLLLSCDVIRDPGQGAPAGFVVLGSQGAQLRLHPVHSLFGR